MNIKKYIPLAVLSTLAMCAGVFSNPSQLFAGPAQGPFVVNPSATSSGYNGIDGSNGQASINKKGEQYIDTIESIKTPPAVQTPIVELVGTIPAIPTLATGWPVSIIGPVPTKVPGAAPTFVAVSVLATQVPSAFGTPPVVNTGNMIQCKFVNTTNQPIYISYGGSVNNPGYLYPGSVEIDDIGSDGATVSSSIFVKSVGSTPSSGTLEITCKKIP